MATLPTDRTERRMAIVEEHIRHENDHDLEGILSTFGEHPRYEEQPWGQTYEEMDGVRSYYAELLHALPDLEIDVQRRHVTENAIVLEVVIRGTHQGSWRGLPPTERAVDFPLCAVYTFTEDDRLAGERIYYDRGTVFHQLGMYREPLTATGRLATAIAHPVTLVRALARQVVRH